jgi:hypothetical protein
MLNENTVALPFYLRQLSFDYKSEGESVSKNSADFADLRSKAGGFQRDAVGKIHVFWRDSPELILTRIRPLGYKHNPLGQSPKKGDN